MSEEAAAAAVEGVASTAAREAAAETAAAVNATVQTNDAAAAGAVASAETAAALAHASAAQAELNAAEGMRQSLQEIGTWQGKTQSELEGLKLALSERDQKMEALTLATSSLAEQLSSIQRSNPPPSENPSIPVTNPAEEGDQGAAPTKPKRPRARFI